MNWYLKVLKKYAVFSGRARRKEFWMFMLFNFIIRCVLSFIEGMSGTDQSVLGFIEGMSRSDQSVLGSLYSLAVLLPSLAVGVRRLHDTGRSGWWLLIGLVPTVGCFLLLAEFIDDSQPGENQYGPNPKGVTVHSLPSFLTRD